ncbi:MAG: hypothetical protein ACRC68_13670, partial [Clostridium sp.]
DIMGLFGDIKKFIKGVSGSTSLKEATMTAPNEIGCYKIFYKNMLKYTGSAEAGINKKVRNLYEGKILNNSVASKIYENRDSIKISWVVHKTKQECKEAALIAVDKYKPEWNMDELKSK